MISATNGSLQDKDKEMLARLSPLMMAQDVKKVGDAIASTHLANKNDWLN